MEQIDILESEKLFDFTDEEQEKINSYHKERLRAYGEELEKIKAGYKTKTGREWDDSRLQRELEADKNGTPDPDYVSTLLKILQAGTREVADIGEYAAKVAEDHIKEKELSDAEVLKMAKDAAEYFITQISMQITADAANMSVRQRMKENTDDLTDGFTRSMQQQDGKYVIARDVAENALDEKMSFFYTLLTESQLQQLDEFIEKEFNKCNFVERIKEEKKTKRERKSIKQRANIRASLPAITKVGIMSDKVSNRMIRNDLGIFGMSTDGQETLSWPINQAAQGRKEVPVLLALSFKDDHGNTAIKKMSAYDEAVYNAVSTCFYYWRQSDPSKALWITPREIYRVMNGVQAEDSAALNATPAQIKKIERSIDKMRFTSVSLDLTEEVKAYKLHFKDERLITGVVNDYLIDASKGEFMTEKGKVVKGYRIKEFPILYTYNREKGHIHLIPFDALNTSSMIRNDEYVTEFKNYLALQIQLLKEKSRDNNTIRIEKIYESTGILTPEQRAAQKTFTKESTKKANIRKMRKQDREKIETLFNIWVKKKWIAGFTPIKQKNSVVAYRIDLGDQQALNG